LSYIAIVLLLEQVTPFTWYVKLDKCQYIK